MPALEALTSAAASAPRGTLAASGPVALSRLPAGARLDAVVAGRAGGVTVLATSLGEVRVAGAPAFPPGARVTLALGEGGTLRIVPEARPAAAANLPAPVPAAPPEAPSSGTASAARALAQALSADVLHGSQAEMLAARLPGPAAMAAPLARFLAAAAAASPLALLLDKEAAARVSREAGPAALRHLAEAFSAAARPAPADASGWRWLAFAIGLEGQARPALFGWTDETERRDDAEPARGPCRFAVEAMLDGLGPVRLDGTALPPRLALAVHCAAPPDEALQQAARAAFGRSLAAAGWSGELAFAPLSAEMAARWTAGVALKA